MLRHAKGDRAVSIELVMWYTHVCPSNGHKNRMFSWNMSMFWEEIIEDDLFIAMLHRQIVSAKRMVLLDHNYSNLL